MTRQRLCGGGSLTAQVERSSTVAATEVLADPRLVGDRVETPVAPLRVKGEE